jgi:hypothetical protein
MNEGKEPAMEDPFEKLDDPSRSAIPDPTFAETRHRRLEQAMTQHWRTSMTVPTFRTGKICYIEIPITDITQSAEFYRRVFGWHICQRGDGITAFDDRFVVNRVSVYSARR